MIVEVALFISNPLDIPEIGEDGQKEIMPKGCLPERCSWAYG